MPTDHAEGAGGGRSRRGLTLVAMTGSLSMIFIDITVVGVALPTIGADLGMSSTALPWVVNAYLLTMASLVALGGRVADRIGRVAAFVAGVLIFAAASAACGLAGSAAVLLAGRAAQGLGAALMQPASGAIVVGSYSPGERGKAMAIYVGIPLLFMVLGPVIGGELTQRFSWRWCFWVNIPIAAASLALTAIARPKDPARASAGAAGPAPSGARRADLLGAAMLVTGLPALVLGIMQGSAWGWSTAPVLALLAGGAALTTLFTLREWNRSRPLLAVGLFRDRGLLANALVLFLMQFAMAGLVVQGSVYAQSVLGFDARRAGLSLLPLLVPTLFVVHVAGRLYDRVGVAIPTIVGTAAATAGVAIIALGAWIRSEWIIALGMATMSTGIGFVMSPTNTDSLSRVPPETRAQVSGLIQTMRHVGGAVGVAVVGAAVLTVERRLLGAGGASAGASGAPVGAGPDPVAAQAAATAVGYAVAALACGGAFAAALGLHRRPSSRAATELATRPSSTAALP